MLMALFASFFSGKKRFPYQWSRILSQETAVENNSTYLSFRSDKNITFQGTSHDPNMFWTTNTSKQNRQEWSWSSLSLQNLFIQWQLAIGNQGLTFTVLLNLHQVIHKLSICELEVCNFETFCFRATSNNLQSLHNFSFQAVFHIIGYHVNNLIF